MSLQSTNKQTRFNKVRIDEIHSNISQEVIEITSDKLRILLKEHVENIENQRLWIAPASLLVTIVLVLCTTTFRDALTVKANVWEAAFIIGALLCLGWLIKSLLALKKAISIEDLLNKIKNKS